MSKHIIKNEGFVIAYGYDPIPGGGYFFQVYDRSKTYEDDEGLIINEGYGRGMLWIDMLALMVNVHIFGFKVLPEQFTKHISLVSENKQI